MDKPDILIRKTNLNDLTEMQKMFVDTISDICKQDYSPEQINVWTSSVENIARWVDKLNTQYFLVAISANKIVGYASLENNDYLDFLYVHKDYQRLGIASQLYNEIEKEAIKRNSAILFSDVSITAVPFFEKKGFRILEKCTKTVRDVEIVNYKMAKQL